MVMSVLLADAVALLGDHAKAAYERGDLSDVIYADDTLLLSVSDAHLSEYLDAIAACGKKYGMELHWGKFQLLPVRCSPSVCTPDGAQIPAKERMEYLGTTLTDDVHDQHELVKRIAMAKADFVALEKVWRRSALTWKRKLAIFHSLIESKLLFGLSSICLTRAQERRLDGFQNRCLRVVIGEKPAFLSRVSNAQVLDRSGHQAATQLLQKRQLQLLGKVLRSPEGHPLRSASFIPGTDHPLTERYVRRTGRPSKEWITHLLRVAMQVFGSMQDVQAAATSQSIWSSKLQNHFNHR